MSPVTFSIAGDSGDTKFADGSASVVAFADGDGIATAMLRPGTQEAEFGVTFNGGRIGCDGSPLPLSFNVTVREPKPRIYLLPGAESGDGQADLTGTKLEVPLRVRVRTTAGELKNGIQVSFAVIDGPSGGAFSNPIAVTGPDGIAASSFIPGSVAGTYVIQATCDTCDPVQNHVNFIAVAKEKKPTNRDRDDETGGGIFPIPSGDFPSDVAFKFPPCEGEVVQIFDTPSGDSPPTSPAPMLTCGARQLLIGCRLKRNEDVHDQNDSCAFFKVPLDEAGAIPANEVDSLIDFFPETDRTRTIRSTSLGLVGIQTQYAAIILGESKSCRISEIRKLAVVDFNFSNFSVPEDKRVVTEAIHNFSVMLDVNNPSNIPEPEKKLLGIDILDSETDAVLNFGTILKKSRRLENNVFHFSIAFPDIQGPDPIFFIKIRVRACDGKSIKSDSLAVVPNPK